MRLRTRLLLAFAYVLVLAVIALAVPLALSLRDRVNAEVRSQAQGQADLIAVTASDLLGAAARTRLDAMTATAAADLRGRVIVVDAGGRVLSDSAGDRLRGASYASRPEVAAALAGRHSQVNRFSASLDRELLATAVPVVRHGRTVGAVRVTQSTAAVGHAVRRATLVLALLGAVVLALGLAAAALIAREIARPLARLEEAAGRVADGDLDARAPEEGSHEQRTLARSFNEMTARLARLLAVQQEFVADASHALRTPLSGVRLRIEEARAAELPQAADAQLEAATHEVDRMAQIVDQLLVLSRAGEHELPAQRLELGAVVTRAAQRWTPVAEAAGLAIRAVAGAGCGPGWAPPADLDRALDALIENAVRYAPAGTTVEIAVAEGAVEVRDRGPGIARAERDLVWARFHRGAAGRRRPGGTGLGLAIARDLARAWGGEADLVPRVGGGTVARLEVPAAAAAVPATGLELAR
jgi:signal transduction histidine kinase